MRENPNRGRRRRGWCSPSAAGFLIYVTQVTGWTGGAQG